MRTDQFPPPSHQSILARYGGMTGAVFIVGFALAVLLSLSPARAQEVLMLEPLVISVTKAEMAPEEVKASISVVTAKEIRQSGARDVLEAIRRTTGLTAGSNDSAIAGRKSIQIRGMESSHVLMLLDGKRLTNTDAQIGHSNFQLNAVPVDSISHIEIVRGPLSSLYGSAGMAGVVNVVTKKAGKTWRSSVDLMMGDIAEGEGGDERAISLTTAGPMTDSLGLRLAVESSETKVTPDKDGAVGETEIEGSEIDAISANLSYEINTQHRLSLDIDHSREDRHRDDPYLCNAKTPVCAGLSR